MAREQDQFLDVVDRDTAERRWWSMLSPKALESEEIALAAALGHFLAIDVATSVDVPPFDRSHVDGVAVQAQDTSGAAEERPCELLINGEEVTTGRVPTTTLQPGYASSIATGAVVPREADAVVMIAHTDVDGYSLRIVRPVAPGAGITFAGTVLRESRASPSVRVRPAESGFRVKPGGSS
jgi:putative molybdopterin biosynthesis protein